MKSSGIGGQAVIEGVMMRNKDVYSVAVRKPNGEIEIEKKDWHSFSDDHKICRVPFIRGIFNLIDSLVIGMGTLTYSADFYEEEPEEEKSDKAKKRENVVMSITMVVAVILALAIFVALPTYLSALMKSFIKSRVLMGFIEGVIRLIIFVAYVAAIALMKDIKRVYMYHGAEHKCINCVEHGLDLTVENVRASSKEHKRCGTSFLLYVVFLSILFSMLIQMNSMWLKMLLRIVLIPILAGIAYEIIRLAGRSDNIIVKIISKPGLMLQALTTREPTDDMIEVGICSVEAVFDWKQFQTETFGKTFDEDTDTESEDTAKAEEVK